VSNDERKDERKRLRREEDEEHDRRVRDQLPQASTPPADTGAHDATPAESGFSGGDAGGGGSTGEY
jgi:hypothetical protein